jgi:hypothetical protein
MAGRAHKRLQQQLGAQLPALAPEEEGEESSEEEAEEAPRRAAFDLLGLLTDDEVGGAERGMALFKVGHFGDHQRLLTLNGSVGCGGPGRGRGGGR